MIDPETKVSEILKGKRASIKHAPLQPGAPSWDEIMQLTWGQILDGAEQRKPGFRMIKKLLQKKEYDR